MTFYRAITNLLRNNQTNWKVLALSFLAAIVFWTFNALNKRYDTNLRLPISWAVDNNRFIAVDPPTDQVTLNVAGSGWQLLQARLGFSGPSIHVSLEHPLETQRLPGSSIMALADSVLSPLKLNYVVTDSLHIHFDEKRTIKMKVGVDLSGIRLSPGHGLAGTPACVPDSVTVTGPSSVLAAFSPIAVINLSERELNSSPTFRTALKAASIKTITTEPTQVEVTLHIAQIDTVRRVLSASQVTLPTSWTATDDSIHIVVTAVHDSVPGIRWSSLQLEPLTSIPSGKPGSFIQLTLRRSPNWMKLIACDSVRLRKRK